VGHEKGKIASMGIVQASESPGESYKVNSVVEPVFTNTKSWGLSEGRKQEDSMGMVAI